MRHTTTVAAAVLLLALTGCSSDSSTDDRPTVTAGPSGDPTTPPTATPKASSDPTADPDTAALETSVRDYTAALFSGNESGYDLLSARCQKQMTKPAWTTMAKDAHQQYGAQKATGVKVDQMSGDLARVSYGAGNIPQFEREAQSWVREGGTWRWDACPSTS